MVVDHFLFPSPLLSAQVETLNEMGGDYGHHNVAHDNTSANLSTTGEASRLENSYWTTTLLQLLALIHFVLSAVLIASYWHFKVCI